ncbi:MAG: hypothetical protein PUH70_03595 [Clostridiales bacterium]|nr:hypothetical protein [Clostridiales bacterium]MDY5515899.1 hypothetical protein [Candidatus Ventricola sp.]
MKSLKRFWAAAQRIQNRKEKAVSEQDAKHPAIETDWVQRQHGGKRPCGALTAAQRQPAMRGFNVDFTNCS